MTSIPESEPLQTEPGPGLEDLVGVFAAAKISLEAARTPLAAISKRTLARQLNEPFGPLAIHLLLAGDDLVVGTGIVVTFQRTVTVPLDVSYIRQVANHLLWLIDEIKRASKDSDLTLIDGLDVSLRDVGSSHVSFGWKQRCLIKQP
jgi:hypothetical protein